MITREAEKLIIKINHPCPKEFHEDLKEAIIGAIQYQNPQHLALEPEKIHFINCTLLELFKNLNE